MHVSNGSTSHAASRPLILRCSHAIARSIAFRGTVGGKPLLCQKRRARFNSRPLYERVNNAPPCRGVVPMNNYHIYTTYRSSTKNPRRYVSSAGYLKHLSTWFKSVFFLFRVMFESQEAPRARRAWRWRGASALLGSCLAFDSTAPTRAGRAFSAERAPSAQQ